MTCAGPSPAQWNSSRKMPSPFPRPLSASYHQLVVESTSWGEPFELVVRDGKTGFVFFNIEGHQYDYDANEHLLSINEGRLLVSKEFATKLGRPSEAGSVVGKISITATMRAIEITQVVNGEATSAVCRLEMLNPEACAGARCHRRRSFGVNAT